MPPTPRPHTSRRRFLKNLGVVTVGGLLIGELAGCSVEEPLTRAADIDAFLAKEVPDGASGSIAVARQGELIYCEGFGTADREADVAATGETVYDICSMTKQFTAAAILKLEMAGELSTTDPISAFIDKLPTDKQRITVHQLLTHTGGLVEAIGDDYDATTRDDMLAAMAQSEALSAPGSSYRYSNVGYSVLAAIVEIVSGNGYEEFLADQLFSPAGMTDTGYLLPQWDNSRIAVEYDAAGKPQGRPNEQHWADDGPYWNLRGNGGLLSTAADMHRWHQALSAEKILSSAERDALFTPHVLEDNGQTHYGYGWVVWTDDAGDRLAGHDGGNDWTYGEFARGVDTGDMIFWITNNVERTGKWNLEDLDLVGRVSGLVP